MKKFEIGKTYKTEDGIEILVKGRTEKNISFIYTTKNWFEENIDKVYRKKIQNFNLNFEVIALDTHWSAPRIEAI